MPFTEFYMRASGDNKSAGSTNTNAATVVSTNGNWSTVTNVFTAASGTPFSSTQIGDWASVHTDAASSTAFIARVTAIGGGGSNITLSATARSGTPPTTAATGITCRIGGAWATPGGPGAFLTGSATNASGHYPRINFTGTITLTAQQTISSTGPVYWRGYGSSPGDGTIATIDGGTSGASYILINLTGQQHFFEDIKFINNGATGSAAMLTLNTTSSLGRNAFRRCSTINSRGNGFRVQAGPVHLIECEAYNCNTSNTATTGGFRIEVASTTMVRCISYGHTGSNNAGVSINVAGCTLIDCIIAGCTGSSGGGICFSNLSTLTVERCTFYNNRVAILNNSGNFMAQVYVASSHFENNTTACIGATHAVYNGELNRCSFFNNGAKLDANSSKWDEYNSVNLASSGLVNPGSGDFTPRLLDMLAAGSGNFLNTGGLYGSIPASYPTIGAVQPLRKQTPLVRVLNG